MPYIKNPYDGKEKKQKLNVNGRDKSYCDILTQIFFSGTCESYTLYAEGRAGRTVRSLVQKMIENEHVQKIQLAEAHRSNGKTACTLTITSKGIGWLATHSNSKWVNIIDVFPDKISCSFPFEHSDNTKMFRVYTSNTMSFAYNVGCSFPLWQHSPRLNKL